MIVLRDDLFALRDALYRLESTLADADMDLADGSSEAEVLAMLTAAAREVARFEIEPIAARS